MEQPTYLVKFCMVLHVTLIVQCNICMGILDSDVYVARTHWSDTGKLHYKVHVHEFGCFTSRDFLHAFSSCLTNK